MPGRVAAVLVRPGERGQGRRAAAGDRQRRRRGRARRAGSGDDAARVRRKHVQAPGRDGREGRRPGNRAPGSRGATQGSARRARARAPCRGPDRCRARQPVHRPGARRMAWSWRSASAVGASVAPGGEALLELGDPSRLQVVAQVPEGELRRVAVGQDAEVELPALAARVAARVESFSPRVDPESRRAQLYLALAETTEGLRAGMLAQVNLRVTGEARPLGSGHRGADQGRQAPRGLCREARRHVRGARCADGPQPRRPGGDPEGPARPGERVVVRGALLLDTQAEQLL